MVKVKVKVTRLRHNGGNKGTAPLILSLGTGWMCLVSFAQRSLYSLGRKDRYVLDGRMVSPRAGLDIL
jgi:hypothetical protein